MDREITAIQKFVNTVIEFFVNYSFQVMGALIILFVGWLVGKWVSRFVASLMKKKKMDVTITSFVSTVAKLVVVSFAVIIALSKFGVTIAPFIAALGALAFGASFAIQGPLSNYGAGLSIILARPFIVGDTITVAGVSGVVKEVKLASTRLADADGVQITIPNKHIVGEIIYNSKESKIVDGLVGISYDANPQKAIECVAKVVKQFKQVAKTPAPQIGVRDFGDSSVNINYRFWVPTSEYYSLLFQVNQAIFDSFKKEGIGIPYPQRDLHIVSDMANGQIKRRIA